MRSDTRCAATTMLAALTTGLSAVREPRLVRQRFEEQLRLLINARSIAFRDGGEEVRAPNVVSLEVPGAPTEMRPRLEAVFDPASVVDDRTWAMLDVAVQVAGLLFEIERANGRWPFACARGRTDGAAPLIGSSPAIRKVRERIEKVATTDFTVLIEGASGSQPHCGFIEVFCEAAFVDRDGEVAGAGEDG